MKQRRDIFPPFTYLFIIHQSFAVPLQYSLYFPCIACYNFLTIIARKGIVVPTILLILGWRFFFYANEGNEPIHIHCKKGDKECKYWIDSLNFDVQEAYSFNMSSRDQREVKKIIFEYFDFIEEEWNKFQQERNK